MKKFLDDNGLIYVWSKITAALNDKQAKVAKLGSTTKPLYTSADGTFATCSTYAGGTKVTLNGTSKAATTASFYAPTSAGTEGKFLVANASGIPVWGDIPDLSNIYATTDTAQTITGQKKFHTATNATPVWFCRGSSTAEGMSIGVTDNTAVFQHNQDERRANFKFIGEWADTEDNSGGVGAGSKYIEFILSSTNAAISINGSNVIHEGNIGSQSVDNADKLDGYHAFGESTRNIIKQGYINMLNAVNEEKWCKIATIPSGSPYERVLLYVSTYYISGNSTTSGTCLIELTTRQDSSYFYKDVKGLVGNLPADYVRLYYNTYQDAEELYIKFPATSSQANRTVVTRVLAETRRQAQNVDKIILVNDEIIEPTSGWSYVLMTYKNFLGNATALATPRTLWGQSFDGSADVNGDMTGVGAVSASGGYTITTTDTTNAFSKVANNNGVVGLYTSENRGIYDFSNSKWLIATNGTNTWLNCGNVAINSSANESYKLYVNGTLGVANSTTTSAVNISNTSGIAHISFARGSYNYIQAKAAGGSIHFITNGKTIDSANTDLSISDGAVSVKGTFGASGATTLGSTLTVTGATTMTDGITMATDSSSTFNTKGILFGTNGTGGRIGGDGSSGSVGIYAAGSLYLRPNSSSSYSSTGVAIGTSNFTYNGNDVWHAGNLTNSAAESGGTDVSLVTTGDKYKWNSQRTGKNTVADYTTNGTNYTTFAQVSSSSTSRYKDCIVLISGGGYYYSNGNTGTWLVEMRSSSSGTPTMTVICLMPPVSTKTVSFGYYTDTTDNRTYFGIKSTGRRGEFNVTVLMNNSDLFTITGHTPIISTTKPSGWVDVSYTTAALTSDITWANITDKPTIPQTGKCLETKDPVFVDLGLTSGTLWATMNVGASTKSDIGNYYMWGKGDKTYDGSDSINNASGLSSSTDTATQVFGSNWSTPTEDQWQELIDECTWTWGTLDGVLGCTVTKNNKSIFFPVSGRYDQGRLMDTDRVYYWGSSTDNTSTACGIYFYSSEGSVTEYIGNIQRYYGVPIRPVTNIVSNIASSKVAISGSYDDLVNKPQIPNFEYVLTPSISYDSQHLVIGKAITGTNSRPCRGYVKINNKIGKSCLLYMDDNYAYDTLISFSGGYGTVLTSANYKDYSIATIWKGTQSQYNNLSSYDDNTIYIIT